jgi:hypothetical protein
MAHWLDIVVKILTAETTNLRELAEMANGDPKTFYVGVNLDDVDFSGQDVTGMHFTITDPTRIRRDKRTKFDPEYSALFREGLGDAGSGRTAEPSAEYSVVRRLDALSLDTLSLDTLSIDHLIALIREREENIFSYARKRTIDPLTLRTQLLLHLPRLVTADYFPNESDIQREILAVSDLLEENQRPYALWLKQPEQPIALDDLEFIPLDANTAQIYHECFHYIGSYRPGRHFAFQDKNSGRIVCIGSVASFDLKHAEELIAPKVNPRSVLMFSRFFAYRWAPKNTLSHFWGKLSRQLRGEHHTKLMFTFVNPNAGFNAGSFKAAHWMTFAHEAGARYMYLDGRYRTMQFFVENYGTNDPDKLKEILGNSFQVSTMDLHPMKLLAIPLQRPAREAIPNRPYLFQCPVVAPLSEV